MRILALDVGEQRIGVATSDPSGTIAQAVGVILRRSWPAVLDRIREYLITYQVDRIVVGLPLRLDGSEGEAAAGARAFAARVQAAVTVPVELQDERLSTAEAERMMVASDMRRAARRQRRDAVAAALFLQTYLDRRR